MSTNHHKPWGDIREVRTNSLNVPWGTWATLFNELVLRLEKTPSHLALEIPFEDDNLGRRAQQSLSRYAQTRGIDMEVKTRKLKNGGRAVYVRRGENWINKP